MVENADGVRTIDNYLFYSTILAALFEAVKVDENACFCRLYLHGVACKMKGGKAFRGIDKMVIDGGGQRALTQTTA